MTIETETVMQVELLQPWSTFVMKTQLPPEILQKMLKITDELIASPEIVSWGENLAGQIEQEFLIPPEILEREDVMGYFKDVVLRFLIEQFIQSFPQDQEDILKEKFWIDLGNMWGVSQKDNEYNPVHVHTNCAVSTVMYLKIPEYLPDRKRAYQSLLKGDFDGGIQFFNNASQDRIWGATSMKVQPQVGDFFIFPASQQHLVYPFRTPDGKGERRSVSFNAKFTRKSEYDALRKQQEEQEVI